MICAIEPFAGAEILRRMMNGFRADQHWYLFRDLQKAKPLATDTRPGLLS
jgi:hypothetical protein